MKYVQKKYWKIKALPRILAVILITLAMLKISNSVMLSAYYLHDQIVIVAQLTSSKFNISIDFTTIKKLTYQKK